ncbi:MAG: diaminopimelate epimerase [Chloroflexi bacterium]|nr:diaminopimelate epimerase [Chloroflexota bacterium]
MDFIKMQGTGNDFVMINALRVERDWPKLAVAMCDRHFGVGADGIVLVAPSDAADLKMRMFNPDGSEAEMCGNGIRCFAKYAIEEGLAPGERAQLTIETLAGLRTTTARMDGRYVRSVRVGMGKPRLAPKEIPVAASGSGPVIDHAIRVNGTSFKVTCVSMGNPHAVAFVDEPVSGLPLEVLGPKVEHDKFFPKRVNFEVANIVDKRHVTSRVWERGAGLTLACGTGACAVMVAAHLKGLVGDSVEVKVPGGALNIEWDGKGEVFLEGSAETVFRGTWPSNGR